MSMLLCVYLHVYATNCYLSLYLRLILSSFFYKYQNEHSHIHLLPLSLSLSLTLSLSASLPLSLSASHTKLSSDVTLIDVLTKTFPSTDSVTHS